MADKMTALLSPAARPPPPGSSPPVMSQAAATGVAVSSAPVRPAPATLDQGVNLPVLVGPWVLEAILGEGTFARVFRARPAASLEDSNDAEAGSYAVKVLRETWHDQPLALLRIRSEGIVGRCVAHRHVAPVLSAHVHRAPYYLVMPLLSGETAAGRIAAEGRLPVPWALWIARQAAEGLEALHTLGYVHGDVRPANILIAGNGHATLIDLGSARRLTEEPALDDAPLVGTPQYLAPELLAGHYPSPRSDVYSLGITLFEMLTGRLPIASNDLAALAEEKRNGRMPSVREFVPQVPRDAAQIVREMTAREPLRRPQRAAEVVRALIRLEISTLAERVA